MSYRDDLEAMNTRVEQLEAELSAVRRERERLRRIERDEPKLVTELDALRRELHARAPRRLPMLDQIRVAAPCHERWDEMTGDEQVRHCARCDKNVYNLSAMTREAAEALVREREGAVCVRYFRRSDGTILTADCPVGVRRRRVRVVAAAGAMTALAAGVAGLFAQQGAPAPVAVSQGRSATVSGQVLPPQAAPAVEEAMQGQMEMGDIAVPEPIPAPQREHAPQERMGRPMLRR